MVDRKFFTRTKENNLTRAKKAVAKYTMKTSRYNWKVNSLKRKIAKQKIK